LEFTLLFKTEDSVAVDSDTKENAHQINSTEKLVVEID